MRKKTSGSNSCNHPGGTAVRRFLTFHILFFTFLTQSAFGQTGAETAELPAEWGTLRTHVNLSTALFLNPLTRHGPIVIRSTGNQIVAEIRSDRKIFAAICQKSVAEMENSDRIEWQVVSGSEQSSPISKEFLDQILARIRQIPRIPERFTRKSSKDGTAVEEALQRIFSSGGKVFRNVEYEVTGDTVTLSGEAATEEYRNMASQIATELPGVEQVENEIQVVPLTEDVEDEFDWLIQSRIQIAFAMNRYLAGQEITVEVQEGVAVLRGKVDSESIASRAASIAAEVVGVAAVENHLEAS